jgi:hypothetical protein
VRAELQDDLLAAFRTLGKTVVMVTHDLDEAAFFGQRLVLMRDGRIVQEGRLEDLARTPADPFVTRFLHAQRPRWSWARDRAPRPGGDAHHHRRLEVVRRVGDPGRDRRRRRPLDRRHREAPPGARGTRLVWDALRSGAVDLYPDYTGTLAEEILAGEDHSGDDWMARALAARGLAMSRPLGFNDTYAIALRPDLARRLGLRRISDLRAQPQLRFGFSSEFMSRRDGWPGLQARYQLPQRRCAAWSTTSPTAAWPPAISTPSTSTPPTPRSRPSTWCCWTTTPPSSPATTPCWSIARSCSGAPPR